jgi:N-acetylneuraminic acid mutarotase
LCRSVGLLEFRSTYIVFFGSACRILIYNIEKNEWLSHRLNSLDFDSQFKMFTSAVTIANEKILLIGGGFSGEIFEFDPKKFSVTLKQSLDRIRTEHASLCIDNKVYVIGGFDKKENKFLRECEIYDPSTNSIMKMAPMQVPKCGFSVAQTQK